MRCFLSVLLLAGFSVQALADPVNYEPPWRSFKQTGQPSDIVSSPTVAHELGKKIDAQNGQSAGQQLQTPTIIGGNAILDALSAPDGDHNGPAVGDRLGLVQSSYPAPDPSFSGSVTVTAPQPAYIMTGLARDARAALYLDWDKNATLQTSARGARISLITNDGAVQVQNTDPAGGAALWFYSNGRLTPITADASGALTIGSAITPSVTILSARFGLPALPTSAPGSGAHFVCVTDAGILYRSESGCK